MPLRSEPRSAENLTTVSVVKVGGSLLTRPELGRLLVNWLGRQRADKVVLIAGGGYIVDALRLTDAKQHIGQSTSHWMAIWAMQQTAQQLAALLPDLQLIKSMSELRNVLMQPGRAILDVQQFMREEEPELPGLKLPEHWDVSSDSIAARLAIVLEAQELVLLKSCSPAPSRKTLQALADSGYVDAFLPHLKKELGIVRLVDLPGWREIVWKRSQTN